MVIRVVIHTQEILLMLKRILPIALLATVMIVAFEPLQTAHGIIMTRSQWLLMNSSDNSMLSAQVQQGHESGFNRGKTSKA